MASGDYGDHAEGLQTTASGSSGAHAEGVNTEASGSSSHAEGDTSKSTGISSHAEGVNTLASGDFGSHAEGVNTEASGHYGAHAAGWYTKATRDYQTVIGKYNALDSNNQATDATFVIGGGTGSSARKDIFSVDWDGNVTATGVINGLNNNLMTTSNMNTILSSLSFPAVYPIYVHSDLINTIFGITGRNGAGLVIKHNSDVYDFVFFDIDTYLVRYTQSTNTYSRKYKLSMTAIS
jgi:hypothetical protein